MATFTAHYTLRKPATGDFVTVTSDINANMDVIDTALFDHDGDISSLGSADVALDARLDVLEAVFKVAFKSADESVTSSTALQDDDHLTVALTAGTYHFELALFVLAASATPDFKWAMVYTGTVTSIVYAGFAQEAASTNVVTTLMSVAGDVVSGGSVSVGARTTVALVLIKGSLECSTSGNLKLQWAQNTSDAGAVTVKRGSNMTIRKVA